MSPKKPAQSGEFDRIRRFFKPLAADFLPARDLSDDIAYLPEKLVITSDMLVENVHFRGQDMPAQIAAKALRVNLSDLAAKGASPYCFSLSLGLPRRCNDDWLAAFTRGLKQDMKRFGVALCGGDSVASPAGIVVNITMLGRCAKPPPSRQAPPGDYDIWVSGTIGDSYLGLRLMNNSISSLGGAGDRYLQRRYWLPQPRLPLAKIIRHYAQAALDISDGLVADLQHIMQQSSLVAEVDRAKIPLSPPARRYVRSGQVAIEDLITGGDDYEVAFLANPNHRAVIRQLAAASGIALSVIGGAKVARRAKLKLIDKGKEIQLLGKAGWQHF